MVEIQRNGKFRVRLREDERIYVSDIQTLEQAVQIAKAIDDSYRLGLVTYDYHPRYDRDDD